MNPDIFRSLFLSYPDALIVTDATGRIVLANPNAAALLRYSVDELVNLNVDVLVPDSARPKHAQYREAYSHAPRPRPMGTQMNLVARRSDGTEVMVEIALSPLQSLGLPLVVAAIRDIGTYPRVKQALRRARYSDHLAQFGRLAVDARDTSLLLGDVPAIAVEALEADVAAVFLRDRGSADFQLAAQAGLPADAIGELFPDRPDTLPGFVVRAGVPVFSRHADEHRFTFPAAFAGTALRSALMVPLLERGVAIGVLAVHARDDRRFGEDETNFLYSLSNLLSTSLQRAQTEEALSHAQRLETVGQLTGGIAHDFNNLLTVIRGNLQVLEELSAIVSDPLAPQLVTAATRATRRGAELTGKLLAFSRRQRLQPDVVDTAQMLDALADMLQRTLDQRILIEVDVQPGCPSILADPGQLESALLNIAINARDAMPDGGTLRFQAQVCSAAPSEIASELAADPGHRRYVEISITDTGSGMPDVVKERAFEPFFTTKEAGRGTGLGLSTVYGFVKQSKGAIGLESTIGRGTRLTLYLPVAPAGNDLSTTVADSADRPVKGLRVLLVEDDADVRAIAMKFLDGMQCIGDVAATAEDALAIMETGKPFDLLLSDIALGTGMRGTQLAAEAQMRRPELRVLLVSGYSAELLDADRDAPVEWELLQKPYSREELTSAISRVTCQR